MNKVQEFRDSFKQTDIQKFTLFWIAFWLGVVGILTLIFKPLGLNYLEHPSYVSGYYFICGLLGLKFFFPRTALKYFSDTKVQLALTLMSSIVFILSIFILAKFIPLTEAREIALKNWEFYFPFFRFGTSLTKVADIFFQQTMILSLVLFLKERCESQKVVVGLFTAVFFLIHIPLLYVFGWGGLVFILPSLFAGTIFSTLILRSSFGLLYSFLVHELFYIVLGISMRLF